MNMNYAVKKVLKPLPMALVFFALIGSAVSCDLAVLDNDVDNDSVSGIEVSARAITLSEGFENYSTFPSGSWTNGGSGGTWAIATDGTKVASQSSTSSGTYIAVYGSSALTDYSVTSKVKVSSTGIRAGLVGRYTDTGNYYMAYLYNGRAYLERRKAAQTSTLKYVSVAYTANTWQTLMLSMQGSTISVWLNGVSVISVVNADLAAGKPGLYNTKGVAKWDDVVVDVNGALPSVAPSVGPSVSPSVAPSIAPSVAPSVAPSMAPSVSPSITPSVSPSVAPSTSPSNYDSGLRTTVSLPSAVTGRSLNVTAYGATPNSPADDDSVGFTAAIAAAVAGDEIYIPDGTYHFITRRVKMKSGVSIRGQSQAGTKLLANFADVSDNVGSYLLDANGGTTNFTISNLFVGMYGGQSLRYAIWLGYDAQVNVSRILLENVTITGFEKMGIGVRNGDNITIRSCTIKDATAFGGGGEGYGIMLGYDNTHTVWVHHNEVGPNLRHGILLQYRAHHNLVAYNNVHGTAEDGIDLHGEDEYSNEIAYNTVYDSLASGFGIGNTGGSPEHYNAGPHNWIHHNEVWNCERGFNLFNESDYTYIEDNYFHNNSDIGMYIYNAGGDNIRLNRNRSMYNSAGARVENSLNFYMAGNVISNNTNYALKTNSGTTGYTIINNDFRNNGASTDVELGSTVGTYSGNLTN